MMLDPFLRIGQFIVGQRVRLMCRKCVADSPPASRVSPLAKRMLNGLQKMVGQNGHKEMRVRPFLTLVENSPEPQV